jgi:hypothetical protein
LDICVFGGGPWEWDFCVVFDFPEQPQRIPVTGNLRGGEFKKLSDRSDPASAVPPALSFTGLLSRTAAPSITPDIISPITGVVTGHAWRS